MVAPLNSLHNSKYQRPELAPLHQDSFRRKDHYDVDYRDKIGTQYVFGSGADFGNFRATSRYAELYNVHPGPPWERGGPLLNVSRTYDYGIFHNITIKGPGTRYYEGDFVPNVYGSNPGAQDIDQLAASCPVNLEFYGPKGWERYKPNAPQSGVSKALIEARQIPHLFFTSTREFVRQVLKGQGTWQGMSKSVAREYLNANYGWDATLRDVKKLLKVFLNHDQIFDQFVDNLRLRDGLDFTTVHTEGYVFQDRTSSSTSNTLASSLYPVLNSNFYPTLNGGRQMVDTNTQIDYWFSAKWRYVIEATLRESGDYQIPDEVRMRIERIIYSEWMNPAIFWDVMPWTWLVGWQLNVSTNLHNLVDPTLPEQAALYAFIMGNHKETQHTVATQTFYQGNVQQRECTRVTEWKMRKTASPFGFGIQFVSLTAKQIAILAALGISRLLPG